MDTAKLLQELRQEYAELGQTIRTLERRTGSNGTTASVNGNRPRRVWTAKQKAALSKAAKARWAAQKKMAKA
jgi:hypothetical protein